MERYESWIGRAKSNYELATVSMTPNMYYEDLCFQIQQSVEKALKGLLIWYGVEPEFTHNIGLLLKELEKLTDIPLNIKEATELTIYAVQTRYPGEYDDITKEEYRKAVKIAKNTAYMQLGRTPVWYFQIYRKMNLEKITLIVLDVDGTMTDGGVYIDNNGVETKKFNIKGGSGIVLAQSVGVEFMILTRRSSNCDTIN